MIAVRLTLVEYHHSSNTYTAQLPNGDRISIDPFVSCALPLTDEEFEKGEGYELVGNTYTLTEYTVYKDQVVPSEGGMIFISSTIGSYLT